MVASGYSDDDDDDVDDDVTNCPECGAEVYAMAQKCNACGHWFVPEDREAMLAQLRRPGGSAENESQKGVFRTFAIILLGLLALGLIAAVFVSLSA